MENIYNKISSEFEDLDTLTSYDYFTELSEVEEIENQLKKEAEEKIINLT